LIHCNSTNTLAIDAKIIIEFERSISPLSNDVLYVAILILQWNLSGFKQVLWLDFDLQFSSFTFSGVGFGTTGTSSTTSSNNNHPKYTTASSGAGAVLLFGLIGKKISTYFLCVWKGVFIY
jgi:hypothetical protein